MTQVACLSGAQACLLPRYTCPHSVWACHPFYVLANVSSQHFNWKAPSRHAKNVTPFTNRSTKPSPLYSESVIMVGEMERSVCSILWAHDESTLINKNKKGNFG